MLTVYTFGAGFGLPDTSPFVVKLETWLRMAKIPYRSERGDLRKAPKRKLPYASDGNRVIADSSHIIQYVEEKHNDPLREHRLSAKERAHGLALKSLFEADLAAKCRSRMPVRTVRTLDREIAVSELSASRAAGKSAHLPSA